MRVNKEVFDKVFLIFCLIGGICVLIAGIQEELLGGIIIGICMILSFFLFYPFFVKSQKKQNRTKNKTFNIYKTIEEPTIKNPIKDIIDIYIEKAVYNYNSQNQPRVSMNKVKELYYDFFKNEIETYKTTTEVNNRSFGIIATATMCCTILNDELFQYAKKSSCLWENIKQDYDVEIPEENKKMFLKMLDVSYLSIFIYNITNEIDDNIDFAQVLDTAIKLYKKENI